MAMRGNGGATNSEFGAAGASYVDDAIIREAIELTCKARTACGERSSFATRIGPLLLVLILV